MPNPITSTDAWIMHCIHHVETVDNSAQLYDIIAYADYVNHAIPTFDEFNTSLKTLLEIEVAMQRNEGFATSADYKNWWKNKFKKKKTINPIKEIAAIEEYLVAAQFSQRHMPAQLPIVEKSVYERAVSKYLSK